MFRTRSVIALGWSKAGDLSDLQTRDQFKARVAEAYPEKKPGAIPVEAGQLYRFVREAREGDVVAYYSPQDQQVHLGRITGSYRHAPEVDTDYPQQRPVESVKSLPRSKFSLGALYELGAAMSFFQIARHADEYLAALRAELEVVPGPEEETGPDADWIEQYTRDFVLRQLATELKGHALAELVAHLLEKMGYITKVSPPGADRGVDILAHRDELGFEPPIIKVQVKSTEGTVGEPEVSALYGKVSASEFGLVVTLGTFSPQTRNFADGKTNLRLINGEELVHLLLHHYENLDPRYKGLIPLRRVYVPERVESAGQ